MHYHILAMTQTKIGDGFTVEGVLVGIAMIVILYWIIRLLFFRRR